MQRHHCVRGGEEMARPHHEELEQHCRINKQHQKDLVTLGHR